MSPSDFYSLFEYTEWHKQKHIVFGFPGFEKNQAYFSTPIWELNDPMTALNINE